MPATYAQALVHAARTRPRGLAYTFADQAVSWAELYARARARAVGLRAHSIAAGDRVVLLLPAGLELVAMFAAVSLLGGVPAVLNPGLPAATALARARRLRPRLVVAATMQPGLAAADPSLPLAQAEELPRDGDLPAEPPVPDPHDVALLQMTSGTTGEPRAVQLSHRAITAWQRLFSEVYAIGEDDVLCGWAPPWHVMGLLRFVVLPPFHGCPSHLVPPAVSSLGDWLETLARVGATLTSATDFSLRHALRLVDPSSLDLRRLRLIASGGEPMRLSTLCEFEERVGLPGVVRPAYGLAEATMGVTSVRRGEVLRSDDAGNVSCGRPLVGVELRILDEHGKAVPPGARGEIVLRSPTLFSGYFEAEDETRQVLRDGWLYTGDCGRLDEGGELFVVGRQRLLIKHAGAAFAPREIEEAVDAVPGVVRSAALGLARGDGREQIVVAAEVTAEVTTEVTTDIGATASDSAARLAAQVARAVRDSIGVPPAEVLLLRRGTLPATETGKLRHAVFRQRLLQGELTARELVLGRPDGWTG